MEYLAATLQLCRDPVRPLGFADRDRHAAGPPVPEPAGGRAVDRRAPGRAVPAGRPDGAPLDAPIDADPAAARRRRWPRFGPRLPFLLKVLAAATPLSLQAHPTTSRRRPASRPRRRRVSPHDSPTRTFKDPFHKPELLLRAHHVRGALRFPAGRGIAALPGQAAGTRTQAHDCRPGPRWAARRDPAADRALARAEHRPGGGGGRRRLTVRRRARPGVHQHLPVGRRAGGDVSGRPRRGHPAAVQPPQAQSGGRRCSSRRETCTPTCRGRASR